MDSGVEVSIAQLADRCVVRSIPTLNIVYDQSKPAGAPCRVASIAKLEAIGYLPSGGPGRGDTSNRGVVPGVRASA